MMILTRRLGCLLLSVCVLASVSRARQTEAAVEGEKTSAAEVVAAALEAQGIEGARVKFREMLAGRDTLYAFKESEFLRLGQGLLGLGSQEQEVA